MLTPEELKGQGTASQLSTYVSYKGPEEQIIPQHGQIDPKDNAHVYILEFDIPYSQQHGMEFVKGKAILECQYLINLKNFTELLGPPEKHHAAELLK